MLPPTIIQIRYGLFFPSFSDLSQEVNLRHPRYQIRPGRTNHKNEESTISASQRQAAWKQKQRKKSLNCSRIQNNRNANHSDQLLRRSSYVSFV